MARNEHSHDLVSPSKLPFVKVNKNFSEAAKNLTMVFHEEGFPVTKFASIFGGGAAGFSVKDCQNHFGKTNKNPRKGDATIVLDFFKKKHLEDPKFRYATQLDDEGRVVNFFLVDGRYRVQYECALLLDETEGTFVWLFETWLKAMEGRHPVSILIDQDRAMGNAVARVFPSSRHRLCLWHVTKKILETFSHVIRDNATFTSELKLLVSGIFRASDFEEQRKAFMLKYSLEDNSWVKDMFDIRRKWVPVYHLDVFFAGMNTKGRSDSINSLYDNLVNNNTTLIDFFHGNEKLLEEIAQEENMLDYRSKYFKPIVRKTDFLLKHASEVYAKVVHDKILKQWNHGNYTYKIDPNEARSNEYYKYTLRSRNPENPSYWKVVYNSITKEVECECKYFYFMGILCGHILRVLIKNEVEEISTYFILKRWKLRANTYRTTFEDGLPHGQEDSLNLTSLHSCWVATELDLDASTFYDTYRYAMEMFSTMSIEIGNHKAKLTTPLGLNDEASIPPLLQSPVEERVEPLDKVLIQNPDISQRKGRKAAPTRLERGIEMSQASTSKKRECKLCLKLLNQKVYGHDKRNCIHNPNRKIK